MATRYLVSGGNGLWNSTTNWSATSGGASGASFPVAADTVIFDAASANAPMTVNVAAACTTITTSSYTGTLTISSGITLTSSSGFNFGSGTVCAGTGAINVTGTTASATSNGTVITGTLNLVSGVALSITDDITVGVLSSVNTSGTVTVNTSTGAVIKAQSFTSTSLTSGVVTGTAKIVLVGTGTVSFPAVTSGYITNNIDINSTSTTFTGNFRYQTGTITYIAGTVNALACTLVVAATVDSTVGLNTSTGVYWGNVTVANQGTINLGSDLNISNTLTYPASSLNVTLSGAFVINTSTFFCNGSSFSPTWNGGTIKANSVSFPSLTSGVIIGTTKIVLVGTGTFDVPVSSWTSGYIANSIDINSTSTTFTGNFRYRTGTITYIAGTVDTTNSYLILTGSTTLNTAPMSWSKFNIAATSTITLQSNLNVGLFTIGTGSVATFSGAFVVNADTLQQTGTSGTTTISGTTIYTNSFISTSFTSGVITGSAKIVLTGTGNVSFPAVTSGYITNNIDINSTSTTFTGNFRYRTGTITYIAGTVEVSSSTLVITASCTVNTSGMDWGNITIETTLTLTLTSAFTCVGTFTIPGTTALNIIGTGFWTRVGNLVFTGTSGSLTLLNNLTVTGTLTTNTSTTSISGFSLLISSLNSVGTLSGTTTIVFNGTGTWSGAGTLTNNTTINTAGTLTISGEVLYRAGTLTYTAGTVNSDSGILRLTAASTLNTGGMTWTNVTLTGTQTLSSALNVSGTTKIIGISSFINTARFTQTGNLELGTSAALTLINNITVTGNLVLNNPGTCTMTSFQVIINGGITTTGTGGVSGTTTLLLNGTGTWSGVQNGTITACAIKLATTINTTGTITFSGSPMFNSSTLTYTAGTIVTTGSTLCCFAATTLNTNGISWDNVFFVGTITLSSNLTVTGKTSINGTTTFVNTGRFTQTGSLELSGGATLTLINNLTVLNNFILDAGGGNTQTMNGFQVTINGGITTLGNGYVSGTTTLLLNGTGTWTSDKTIFEPAVEYSSVAAIKNNTTINTAGTITFSGVVSFNTGTLTYTAGTIVTTGSTLNCYGATTLNTSGIDWDNIQISGTITLPSTLTVTGTTYTRSSTSFTPAGRFTQTGNLQLYSSTVFTLPNNITVTGNLSTLGSATNHIVNSFQISVGGLVLSETAGATLSGTSAIVLNGTGTWSGAVTVLNNLSINTTGTVTVSGPVSYSTGTLTYVTGTVNTTGSTLTIKGSSTLNTTGMQWGALDIDTAATVTLPSQLYTNDIIYLDSTGISFAGAGGFSCYGISQRVIGTIMLASGVTFTVRNSFESISSSNASRSLFQSSTPGTQAILTLEPSASQSIGYVGATDIDSSLGQKIWTFKGTLNNATNWQELTASSTGTSAVSAGGSYTWVS